MKDYCFCTRDIALLVKTGLLLVLSFSGAASANESSSLMVEVFTTTKFPVTQAPQGDVLNKKIIIETYVIDGIHRYQQQLSKGLPRDVNQAKQQVLKRLQSMNAKRSQPLENAAKGLAKAMQYGLDRTPAVVFDGQVAVYGITDIDNAMDRYHRWKKAHAQ